MSEANNWVTGRVTLSVNGAPLPMEMTVPADPVKPQRMLPVFHKMTDSFVEIGVAAAAADGRKVSCAAGCGACCRQMVPIAEIEAHHIAGLVAALPEDRRAAVRARFDDALNRLAEAGFFEKLDATRTPDAKALWELGHDYFELGIACPFLEEESCSIHHGRPVACREYLVSSPPENCSSPTAESIRTIEPPVVPSKPLRRLGQTRAIAGIDFIPMVLALKWVEENPDRFPEKTGEEWMADFFRALTNGDIPGGPPDPARMA